MGTRAFERVRMTTALQVGTHPAKKDEREESVTERALSTTAGSMGTAQVTSDERQPAKKSTSTSAPLPERAHLHLPIGAPLLGFSLPWIVGLLTSRPKVGSR